MNELINNMKKMKINIKCYCSYNIFTCERTCNNRYCINKLIIDYNIFNIVK
jgi:hypothetical protein